MPIKSTLDKIRQLAKEARNLLEQRNAVKVLESSIKCNSVKNKPY